MSENIKHNADKNYSLDEKITYEFDKNSFIVEPVFKTEKSQTLGTVLFRLMTQKE